MASSAIARRSRDDPGERLTQVDRERYQQAAELIRAWRSEDPSYDEATWTELEQNLPHLRTRVREGTAGR